MKHIAKALASMGRAGDTTLVHMAPDEVKGLDVIARAHGLGGLTRNPKTGLMEAGVLKMVLGTLGAIGGSMVGTPMVGGAVGGGLGAGIGGALEGDSGDELGKDVAMGAAGGTLGGYMGGAGGAADASTEAATNASTNASTGGTSGIGSNTPSFYTPSNALPSPNAPLTSVGTGPGMPSIPEAGGENAAPTMYKAPIEDRPMNYINPNTGERLITTPDADPSSSAWDYAKSAGSWMKDNPVQTAIGASMAAPMVESYGKKDTQTPIREHMAGQAHSNRTFNPVTGQFEHNDTSFTEDPGTWRTRYAAGGVASLRGFDAGGGTTSDPNWYKNAYQGSASYNASQKSQKDQQDNEAAARASAGSGDGLIAHWGDSLAKPLGLQSSSSGGLGSLFSSGSALEGLGQSLGLGGMHFAAGGHVNIPNPSHSQRQGLGSMFLQGQGDGMSDSIPAYIDGGSVKEPIRVADGEFIIPADVVSHIGNGSSAAGSRKLDKMMSGIRSARTGKSRQAPAIKADKFLPK